MFRVIAAGTQVNTDIRNDGKIFVSSNLTITTKIQIMIEECIRNTYEVLTEKQSIESILEDEPTSMFYGNPFKITLEDIDEMINFFENTEEYEKCSELGDYKNLKDLDIFLENLRIKNGTTNYWI